MQNDKTLAEKLSELKQHSELTKSAQFKELSDLNKIKADLEERGFLVKKTYNIPLVDTIGINSGINNKPSIFSTKN